MKMIFKPLLFLTLILLFSCETEEVSKVDLVTEEFESETFLQELNNNKTSTLSGHAQEQTKNSFKTKVRTKRVFNPLKPSKTTVSKDLQKYLISIGLRKPPKYHSYHFKNLKVQTFYVEDCNQIWGKWRRKMLKNCENRWRNNKKEKRKCKVWAGDHYKWARNRYCRK